MNNYSCMLCGERDFVVTRTFRVVDVIRLYEEKYKIDVSGYFDTDMFGLRKCCHCGLATYSPALCAEKDLYEQLQRTPMYYEEDKPEYDFAIDALIEAKPKHVLEIGCGAGSFLEKIRSAYSVAGSEVNPVALAGLQEKGVDIDSEGRQYDFVLAFQVLEHIDDPGNFIAEVIDKLKSGGHLLLTVPNPDAPLLREVDAVLNFPPHHITCWSMQALEYLTRAFPLTKVADYCEPQRIEHYQSIVFTRRRQLVGNGFFGRVMMFLGSIFDAFYIPFAHGSVEDPGHTHGILFRKN